MKRTNVLFSFETKFAQCKEVRGTTVEEFREALAEANGQDEVVIYADVVGEWVDIPPFFDKRAAVCGYFVAAGVSAAKGMVILTTGAEAAL